MLTADLLIAPLRILLTALGTGILPGNDPVTALAALAPDLDGIRDDALAATATVADQWHGAGATAAVDAGAHTARQASGVAADGAAIVEVTRVAAGHVEQAARE
ncbi:MAG: hydrolase Nlp/P60, partial [Gordonia sp. (in: high G+C Gram-positive bacteria)]